MAKDEPQGTAELVQIPNEKREGTRTVQALEVGVFDNGDERRRTAANMVLAVDGIGQRRATEHIALEWRECSPLQGLIILGLHSHCGD
jgi:hypothetical protein